MIWGVLFLSDHGKRRNARRYNLGCNLFFPSLPVPKEKLHPKPYHLAKETWLHNFITRTK